MRTVCTTLVACMALLAGFLPSAVSASASTGQAEQDTAAATTVRADQSAATADVTGDGIDDLIVSTTGRLHTSWNSPPDKGGAIYVVPGGSELPGTGSRIPVVVNQETDTVPGTPESDDHFGFALATADFNADGRDDVAIGVPYEDIGSTRDAGLVQVLYGKSSAPYLQAGATSNIHQNLSWVPGAAEQWDRFGQALSAGDYNNDGYADLAISVAYEDLGDIHNPGMVTVMYGGSGGFTNAENFHQNTSGIDGAPEAGDHFGWSLASGDVTGDGIDDLALVADGEQVSGTSDARGDIGLLPGSAGGLNASAYSNRNVSSIATQDRLSSIVVGKLQGGRYADVIVAADRFRGNPPGSGAIVYLRGSGSGIANTPGSRTISQNSGGISDVVEAGDRFGQALAVGDLTGDGIDDLAIGAPGEDAGRGAAHILRGHPSGQFTDVRFTQASPGIGDVRQDGEKFGRGVVIHNLQPGGGPELIVTAPNEENSLTTAAAFILDTNGTTISGSTKLNQATLNGGRCGSSVIISCFGPGYPIAGGSSGPIRDADGLPRRTP